MRFPRVLLRLAFGPLGGSGWTKTLGIPQCQMMWRFEILITQTTQEKRISKYLVLLHWVQLSEWPWCQWRWTSAWERLEARWRVICVEEAEDKHTDASTNAVGCNLREINWTDAKTQAWSNSDQKSGLCQTNQSGSQIEQAYLPNDKDKIELPRPMKTFPITTKKAQRRWVPRRPLLSMTRLATRLPARPPIVKTDVTKEKARPDIGMHVEGFESIGTRPGSGVPPSQVKTAWIWFNTEIWYPY